VTSFYPSSTFGGVWCDFEGDTLTWVCLLSNKYSSGSNPATNCTAYRIIEICQNDEHFWNMVNTHRKHVRCVICIKILFSKKWLEAHNQHDRAISMNEGLLPNGYLPPAGFPHPEASWLNYSRCTSIAIEKLPVNDLLLDNVVGAPPPEVTPKEEYIDSQQPDLTCSTYPIQTKAHTQVVGVEIAGGNVYGEVTGLYNKHQTYTEQWNPWHLFWSAYNFQHTQSFSQQIKTWTDQHLRHGLDNIKMESFQTPDTLQQLLSELDCGLSNDSWIHDDSPIFRTLYYRDVFKCIQFLQAHLPFLTHLDYEPVCLTDSEGHRIYCEMNTGECWWNTADQFPAGATIVPVISVSDKTHLTNLLHD